MERRRQKGFVPSTARLDGQRGFTMLELLLVAAVSIIVFAAIMTRAFGLIAREGGFRETRQLGSRAAAVSQLMKTDADMVGYGLTQPRLAGSGTEVPVFQTSAGVYNTSNGSLIKLASGSHGAARLTRGLEYGNGSFTFTPHMENVSVFMLRQTAAATLGVTPSFTQHASITVGVGCNCVYITDPSGTQAYAHQAGDAYQYNVEFDATGTRVLRYYQLRGGARTLLATSTAAPPSLPVTFAASSVSAGTAVTNTALVGSPIIDLSTRPEQFALLPMDNGVRMASPVSISPDGQTVLFFGGDPDTDVMTTDFIWTDAGYGGGLPLTPPARGTINAGDYVMMVDIAGQHSALFLVTENNLAERASGGNLEVVPARSTSPAWGRFYSAPNDYTNCPACAIPQTAVFPKGSRVVKMAAPVEWTYSGGVLLRRELGGPTTVVDLGVTGFAFRAVASATGDAFTYEVVANLQSEGVESASAAADRATAPVTFTLAPPHLNLTYHQQP